MLSDGDGNPRAYFGTVGGSNGWVFTSTDQTNRINASETVQIIGNTSSGTDYSLFFSSQTGATAYATRFYSRTSSAVVGSITFTGSTTAYNTSSDYRLKENVQPMTGALAKVAALNPVTYTWKIDGSTGEGFIAHELAEVCPQAVNGAKDAVDAEGNPVYQGIDVSFLVGTLTAAIQELKAEFDAYKATHP